MLCFEESQVFSSTIELLLLAPALYLVSSQTHFRKKGRVWSKAYTSCVPPRCTVQYNHMAVFCHMMHYMTV